jgi:F-box protein 18 (helicase)
LVIVYAADRECDQKQEVLPTVMTPTTEQARVIDAEIPDGGMVNCIAYAGTGKTTTFVEFARANHPTPSLYLAYNKSVQTEAETRFPGHVKVKTTHSLAWSQEGRKFQGYGNVRHFDVMKRLKVDVYASTLICTTLDNWIKSADQDFMPKHAAEDRQKRYKVDITTDLLKSAKVIWKEMLSQGVPNPPKSPFMMTHDGYLKMFQLTNPRLPQKFILLDEAQDSNPVTLDIVMRQRQYGAKVLLAGDPYQQIYSWRGAVNAMRQENCETFYLTQSWRFGPNVANVANTLLKTFFNEKVPLVGNGSDAIVSSFAPGDVYTIICRTNVELFGQAINQVAAGKTIHVIGDQGFQQFLDTILDVYFIYARQTHMVKDKSLLFFKTYDDLKQFAIDREDAELLSKVAIVDKHGSQVPRHVETIRKANVPQRLAKVVLVTAHKSKGLEWDNVMLAPDFTDLLDTSDQPLRIKDEVLADKTITDEKVRKALLEEAVDRDEINLVYVAATRAKKKLKINGELNRLMEAYAPVVPAPAAKPIYEIKSPAKKVEVPDDFEHAPARRRVGFHNELPLDDIDELDQGQGQR